MKLTVLGKYGPYPKEGGATSGYLLQEGVTAVALDFGSGVLGRMDEFCKIEDLDAIVLSHLHFDHTSDLLPLSYRLKEKKRLYLPAVSLDSPMGALLQKLDCYEIVAYDENSVVKIGELTLTFAPMVHPVPSFAIKAIGTKAFVYTGDTVLCEELVSFCKGADLTLADASQEEGFVGPHMSVADAYSLKKQSLCPRVLCSHVPPAGGGKSEAYEGLVGVEEGVSYEI